MYNLKKIQVVPSGNDFLDIVLSKTQRKTPTVVHKGYAISRIRNFYMRKVKFTQETFDEKLTQILQDFPKLEDIHPFYADLMNILYDRDHYKLALGQINSAKHMIDGVGKEYLKLLKFGDSLYRCKQLKRAALGRMATIMKRQKDSLAYLEQVRQHLARLPCIDPNARTLLLCGYPNVGKSSFMNKLTRAEVDVQPYAFTTKSLFVGHMDYQYLRWQVIDTPGILDHPLEDRNTIEMQSITALAHLRACVLYFIDVSEMCGYSLDQQLSLFRSIKPLFQGKPILLVANKSDVLRTSDMPPESRQLLEELLQAEPGLAILETSTMNDDGVMEARNVACEKLLALRIENKTRANGKAVDNILNRLHMTVPKARDDRPRPAVIPPAIQARITAQGSAHGKAFLDPMRPLELELEREAMDAQGFFNVDLKKHYLMADKDWTYDAIPEIFNGKNVADFIDPEIEAKLQALEEEEEERAERGEYERTSRYKDEEDEQLEVTRKELLKKRSVIVKENTLKKKRTPIPLKMQLLKKKHVSKKAVAGPEFDSPDDHEMADRVKASTAVPIAGRSSSRALLSRSSSTPMSIYDLKSRKIGLAAQKYRNRMGRAGEADRHHTDALPRHLFSGKRKQGSHDRR